jgi:hypothetical protein
MGWKKRFRPFMLIWAPLVHSQMGYKNLSSARKVVSLDVRPKKKDQTLLNLCSASSTTTSIPTPHFWLESFTCYDFL